MIVALATQTVVILALLAALLWREREHGQERAALTADARDERLAVEATLTRERLGMLDRFEAERQELLTRIQRPDIVLPPQRLVEAPQEQEPAEVDEFDLVGTINRTAPDVAADLEEGLPA